MLWYNIKDVYYYTYEELKHKTLLNLTFDDIIKLGDGGVAFITGTTLTAVEEIFAIACLKYNNWNFIKLDEELEFTASEISNKNSNKLYDLARRLKLWYYSTYEKFTTILNEYDGIKAHLVDNIESVVVNSGNNNNYDNDTPQTKIEDGNVIFDKSHASYYRYGDSENTQTSQVNTMYNLEKLDMLKDKITNLKDEWATTLKDYILEYAGDM